MPYVRQIKETVFPIHMNLSRCHYQQKKWKVALQDVERAEALHISDPTKQAKVAFLLGKCHFALGQYETAIQHLQHAQTLPCDESATSTISTLLHKAKIELKRDKEVEKRAWQGRLQETHLYDDIPTKGKNDSIYAWGIAGALVLVVAISSSFIYTLFS